MLTTILLDIAWAALYAVTGGIIGGLLIIAGAALIPKALNHFTPHIDEVKEIIRGNRAVAEYFGRINAAAIIGMSIVVAAAVLGGLLAALHG